MNENIKKFMSRLENKNQEREAEEIQIIVHYEFCIVFFNQNALLPTMPQDDLADVFKAIEKDPNWGEAVIWRKKFAYFDSFS